MDKAFDLLPSLTPFQAAKLLNLPTQTIRDMIKRKQLPAINVGGGQWRIATSEVRKIISHSF